MSFSASSLFKPWKGWPNVSSNLQFIFAFLAVITLPVDVEFQYCSIATALLFVTWAASGDFKNKWHVLREQKGGLLLIAFFLLHIVGLAYTSDYRYGFSIIERMLSLLVIPLVLLSAPLNEQQRDVTLLCFIIFCVLLSVIGFYYGVTHFKQVFYIKGPEHLVTAISNIHRVYFSIYLFFCYLSLFYYYRKYSFSKKPWLKWLSFLLWFLMVFFLFVMASRIALILLILSTAFIVFYFIIIRKKQYVLAGIIIAIAVSFVVFVYNKVYYIKTFADNLIENLDKGKTSNVNSVNMRVVKFRCAMEGIRENWLWGVGTGDVKNTLNELYKKNGFHLGYQMNMDAHNQYLQTWLGLGLPGLLLLSSIFILALWRGFKTKSYLFAILTLLFAISCSTESMLTTQKGIVFLALFFPLLYPIQSPRQNLA